MTTEYLLNEQMEHVLSALTPSNRLVMRVCLHTGLRVGDVLALRTEQLLTPQFLDYGAEDREAAARESDERTV